MRVAIAPVVREQLKEAVQEAGGNISEAETADAVVWTDPSDPAGLDELLKKSPARWVQLPFAGIDSFIEAGVIDSGRTWTCTKGVYGHATAEHALALVLAAARRLHEHVKAGSWREGFTHLRPRERQMKGTTVLIVGTGGVGRALAEMLQPLKPRILAINRSGRPLEMADRTGRTDDLFAFLSEADFVVLATSLTPETKSLLDHRAFKAMKPDAWLINVARGGLVDTDALVAALRAKEIGGAALDVTDPEPLPADHPLWGLENVLITSHVAIRAEMAIPELRELLRRNVIHFGAGEQLEGLIDLSVGY